VEHPGQFSVGTAIPNWSNFGRRQHNVLKDKLLESDLDAEPPKKIFNYLFRKKR